MSTNKTPPSQEEYYRGIRTIPYDLVKELFLALAGVGVVAIVVAAALSSPDVAPVTIAAWAQSNPIDFVTTSTNELAGATTSSAYGAPYNSGSGSMQHWGPIAPQSWFGVRIPIDSANAFVIQPLTRASVGNSDLFAALDQYQKGAADQQGKWLTAYTAALGTATVLDGKVVVATGDYGPLPVMMSNLLGVAQAGGLDGLLTINGRFYQTDYTQPLLFMGDGTYLAGLAQTWNLKGAQWGVMNETGQYPGQTWLWLYTFWYQVWPFTSTSGFLGLSAANADLGIIIVMTVLTIALALVPLIPGLRDMPRWIPIHRLIWRRYYTPQKAAPART
jgi:hypothetical protein